MVKTMRILWFFYGDFRCILLERDLSFFFFGGGGLGGILFTGFIDEKTMIHTMN